LGSFFAENVIFSLICRKIRAILLQIVGQFVIIPRHYARERIAFFGGSDKILIISVGKSGMRFPEDKTKMEENKCQ